MHYGLTNTLNLKQGECLVLGILSGSALPELVAPLNTQLHGVLHRLAQTLHENGHLVWQSDADGHPILIIHCGDAKTFTSMVLRKRIKDIACALTTQRIQTATLCIPRVTDKSADAQLQQTLLTFDDSLYQCHDFKSGEKKPHRLESLQILMEEATEKTLQHADAVMQGIRFARHLANLPANVCTPTYLATQALKLSKLHGSLKTRVMAHKAIEKMGMGALLAVAKGSAEPPQFIEIEYRGDNNKAPIVLVGKGVTFDSGGISLKPPSGMEEMKFDMAGAASVLGTMKACALLKLPIHVIGLIPTTENMPSGAATKPGDIVTSMSGQTIEIVNTDAEGRLILADALTYAERFNPLFVIDIATLTGAIITALGHDITGLFTEDDALANTILTAADVCGEATWRQPIHSPYKESIDGPLSDMVNSTADKTAGSIRAACFLSRFTQKYRWAHLDIAGTAWVTGKNRNATGRPVSLLLQILTDAC